MHVEFSIQIDSLWSILVIDYTTTLDLEVKITNLEAFPIQFAIMDKIIFQLKTPTGNHLKMNGGQDILLPFKNESGTIELGKSFIAAFFTQLMWVENDIKLRINDDYGNIWWIGPLRFGKYFSVQPMKILKQKSCQKP